MIVSVYVTSHVREAPGTLGARILNKTHNFKNLKEYDSYMRYDMRKIIMQTFNLTADLA